jgi:hypothetical protein
MSSDTFDAGAKVPHYQLQPWLIPAATRTGQIDLGSPDPTEKRTGTMSWRYENKIKVA